MRYFLLFFLIGCNDNQQFYKDKSPSYELLNSQIELLERDNENLNREIKILENRLNLVVHLNTCWKIQGSKTYYKIGDYNKEKHTYPSYVIFILHTLEDVNGKEVKVWKFTEDVSIDYLKDNAFKVKCRNIL